MTTAGTSSITVRQVEIQDQQGLWELVREFATSFAPDRSAFMATLAELQTDPSCWLRVAVRDGRLLGYALGFDHRAFYANGRVSFLEEIMVAEAARRAGVGRALMDAFAAWARARDSRLVGLATRRAAPFYEALGYEASATFYRALL